MDIKDLENRFKNRNLYGRGREKSDDVSLLYLNFAKIIDSLFPEATREKALAITRLEESYKWLLSAISEEEQKL